MDGTGHMFVIEKGKTPLKAAHYLFPMQCKQCKATLLISSFAGIAGAVLPPLQSTVTYKAAILFLME
eukprot:1140507-Pelagomonas_calceolata.AAC.2